MRKIAYIIMFLMTVLPFLVLAYIIQLRLFILVPALWITYLFFRGVKIKEHDRTITFSMEEPKHE